MTHPMENTLQTYLRVQSERESMQGILFYHLSPSPEKRQSPPLLGGHSHLQRCRALLIALGCEESRLRQRLQYRPAPDQPSRAPMHHWSLQPVGTGQEETRFPLATQTLVGRGRDCDLLVPLPEVSRKHVTLTPNSVYVALTDLQSSNGTTVNGQRVRQAVLQEGDVIGLAGATFQLVRHHLPAMPDDRSQQLGCLLA